MASDRPSCVLKETASLDLASVAQRELSSDTLIPCIMGHVLHFAQQLTRDGLWLDHLKRGGKSRREPVFSFLGFNAGAVRGFPWRLASPSIPVWTWKLQDE